MRSYHTAISAQTLGSQVLCTVATKDGGFKRGSVAKDCVGVACAAMETFSLDAALQGYAALLLGWACYG